MSEKHVNATPLTDIERNLCEMVDKHQDDLIELLKNLISIDSQTIDHREYSDLSQVFEFAENWMKEAGYNTEIIECPHLGEESGSNKKWPNLLAKLEGDKPGKFYQFNGHLDVVPFSAEKWSEGLYPQKPVIKDGKLYGRGTADMKGGIAAQMMACKLLKDAGLPIKGKMQLWLVPDEEINGYYGAQYMSQHHKDLINADATVISEPTGQPPIQSPAIIVGEKGHKWLKFTVYGSAGHGSMPKPKSNAINKTVRFIQNVKKLKLPKVKAPLTVKYLVKGLLSRYTVKNLLASLKPDEDEEPDPYNEDGIGIGAFFNSTLSFTKINAGSKVNVIPDLCDFTTDIRVLPGISSQDVFDSIANYCTKLGYRVELPPKYKNIQRSPKILKRPVDIKVDIISLTPGTFVDPDNEFTHMFADTFEDVYNVSAVYFFAPGSTDAVHMRAEGVENVIAFGPTGGNTHDSDEFVILEHLIKTCKVFLVSAYRMLCQ
jgi:succinyl-diaminopimelate desuccinylase